MTRSAAILLLSRLVLDSAAEKTADLYDTIATALNDDFPHHAENARIAATLIRESERRQLRLRGLLDDSPEREARPPLPCASDYAGPS